MPYCKSVAIHGHVDKTLKYILDPNKTEALMYTSSINCMTEADLAYAQMKAVYEQYARRRYDTPQSKSGKSPVKAIHYIISFADSENVTPELAHKIGKASVRKNFGEDAQVVIATHTNTDHMHCHILVNSCSLSGKRFYDNKKSLRIVRENTNGVCRAYGVTPALNFENKGRSIGYYEWTCKKNGISWKEHIRNAVDNLIPSVSSLDDLLAELERQGYSIKRDKHIYVKAPGQQRAVSLWKLGEDYTKESLNSRILWRMVVGNYALNALNNDPDIYKQLAIINRDGIKSVGDLEGRISRLTFDYKILQAQLSRKLMEQEDNAEMSSNIITLKNSLAEKKNKIAMYTDIRDTYYEISSGDYISKLVEEKKQHREQERQKKISKKNKSGR
ncbi:relaxase/mobilization nuclease domain-containing protein [Ruminococcus sp.]|uniref:relaxase/mobilization nuclease domain-containing protein n=1 Tax=Ruminococcus sp. TaxID=41978 RepID=UPI002588E026|nr:relaxase/mobilization nuclease domain-containing protein [Ruminococcus sp.]